MDPTHRVVGLNPQTNMVFTVVKPVMGILQMSPQSSIQPSAQLQPLQHHLLLQPPHTQVPGPSMTPGDLPPQIHLSQEPPDNLNPGPAPVMNPGPGLVMNPGPAPVLSTGPAPGLNPGLAPGLNPGLATGLNLGPAQGLNSGLAPGLNPGPSPGLNPDQDQDLGESGQCSVEHLPFAEVPSLLDPNMKGSKARKYLISYDEIRRRLQPPEKMSLRSIAAYTRVSRGPASKKSLQESLSVLGLSPSTTTAVSSSFSKLTEGDTRALCEDMRDFSQDYVDYENVAKQLIPKTNTVQHWSKIIETKNHLEDLRRCLQDPAHSQAFDSVTHGLGLGMVHVVLDMVSSVIQHQIRILSGSAGAASDLAEQSCPSAPRRSRKRHRKFFSQRPARDGEGTTVLRPKSGGRGRKKAKPETGGQSEGQTGQTGGQDCTAPQTGGSDVLLLTVGYETVSEINTTDHVTQDTSQN